MEAIPLLDPPERAGAAGAERDGLFERLPNRQRRVLHLVADGLSDEEIASRTGQTEDRVASMVSGLLVELGIGSRRDAISYVIGHDIALALRRPRLRARPEPVLRRVERARAT